MDAFVNTHKCMNCMSWQQNDYFMLSIITQYLMLCSLLLFTKKKCLFILLADMYYLHLHLKASELNMYLILMSSKFLVTPKLFDTFFGYVQKYIPIQIIASWMSYSFKIIEQWVSKVVPRKNKSSFPLSPNCQSHICY